MFVGVVVGVVVREVVVICLTSLYRVIRFPLGEITNVFQSPILNVWNLTVRNQLWPRPFEIGTKTGVSLDHFIQRKNI